jgi:hypothetical protein
VPKVKQIIRPHIAPPLLSVYGHEYVD